MKMGSTTKWMIIWNTKLLVLRITLKICSNQNITVFKINFDNFNYLSVSTFTVFRLAHKGAWVVAPQDLEP